MERKNISALKESNQIVVQFSTNFDQIIQNIQLSTNLLYKKEWDSIIQNNLDLYNCQLMKVYENTTHLGEVLVYNDDENILFFGYFRAVEDNVDSITLIINELKKYAKKMNFSVIRGPINVPTTLYGWGFMKEGSKTKLFLGCPVQSPIYNDIFILNNFELKFEELRYKLPTIRYDPFDPDMGYEKKYNWDDYEYHNPQSIEEVLNNKQEIVNLHASNMPPSAYLSPSREVTFHEIIKFIFDYGTNAMIFWVIHKPTQKMISFGYVLPNIFQIGKHGVNSLSLHDWVVDKNHRRKGISILMYGLTSVKVPKSITRGNLWPVGSKNVANKKNVEKMGGRVVRTHLIYEYVLK